MICQPNCTSGAQIKTRGWRAGNEWGLGTRFWPLGSFQTSWTTWFLVQALSSSLVHPWAADTQLFSEQPLKAKWKEERLHTNQGQPITGQPSGVRVTGSAQA